MINDEEENTNIVVDNPYEDHCMLNHNNRIEFIKVKEKVLGDNYDNIDMDFDGIDVNSITENEIENIIVKEKNKQMDDDEIIDYLLNSDVNKDQEVKSDINKISIKLQSYLEKKNKKLETIQEKINEEKNKELTFMPNNANKKKKLRTFQEFINSQKEHIQKVQEKILMIRQQLNDDESSNYHCIPIIDNNSRKIFAKNQNQNVYDRLYNAKKIQCDLLNNSKSTNSIQSCKSSFISKNKEEYLNNLYFDAKKRQERLKEKQAEIDNEMFALRAKSSINSNKILYNKFKSQFQSEVNNLLYDDCESITYREYITLLKRINFISDDAPNTQLINIIYSSLLYDESSKKIMIDHLFIFCLAVLGLLNYYIISSFTGANGSVDNSMATIKEIDLDTTLSQINNELAPKITLNKTFGGFDENKNYIITPIQSKYIFNECIELYHNWKSKVNSVKQRSKSPSFSFLPTTHSMRSLRTEGSLFTHINQSIARKKALEKGLLEAKLNKERNELNNCTFRPMINRKTPFENNIISLSKFENRLSENINEMLYQRGTVTTLNRFDRDKNEVEYERQMKECTFQPKINNDNKRFYTTNNNSMTFSGRQEEDKYIERYRNSRNEREFKNSFLGLRNYDYHSSSNIRNRSVGKMRVNKENMLNKRKLIIAIDVGIKKGIKKKLFVYQGDKAEQLAKEFAMENSKNIYFVNYFL